MKKSMLILTISMFLGIILGLCVLTSCSRENKPEDSTSTTSSSSELEPSLEDDPEPKQIGIKYVDSDGNEYKVIRRLVDKSEKMQVVFQNTETGKVSYMSESRFEEKYTATEYTTDDLDEKGDMYIDEEGYKCEVIIRYRICIDGGTPSACIVLFQDFDTKALLWAYEGDFESVYSPIKK